MLLQRHLDELNIRVKTFLALHEAGAETLSDILALTERDLWEILGEDREEVDALFAALAGYGVHLHDDTGIRLEEQAERFRAPSMSWGSLFVWRQGDDTEHWLLDTLRAVLTREEHTVTEVGRIDRESLLSETSPPAIQLERELRDDLVWIQDQEAPGWWAIQSSEWELAPPLHHPLAEQLSRSTVVISLAAVQDHYSEVTFYDKGSPTRTSLIAPRLPEGVPMLPVGMLPLDLTWFTRRESMGSASDLWQVLDDLDAFGSLTGCEAPGWRRSLERGDLPKPGRLLRVS